MNIKTLQRAAKREGYTITQEYDPEFRETQYIVTDRTGKEIAVSNDKGYLCRYLAQFIELASA